MSRFARPLAIGELVRIVSTGFSRRPHLEISAGVNRFTSLWSSLGYRGLGHRTLGGTNDCTLQSIVTGRQESMPDYYSAQIKTIVMFCGLALFV
jgi:hypothetical protein